MKQRNADWILWGVFALSVIVTVAALTSSRRVTGIEGFDSIAGISLQEMSTQALDAAPSTSEVKQFYKTLLVFANADIRAQGPDAFRILADFRDRVYGPRNFRDDLTYDEILNDLPDWMPPLDTTIREPVPAVTEAVHAEAKMLSYLQKYFPREPEQMDTQTASVVRGLMEDFGYRFVFKRGIEVAQPRADFMTQSLLKDWRNPVMTRRVAGAANP